MEIVIISLWTGLNNFFLFYFMSVYLKDELLAELAELEQEELEESMKNMARLPSAPASKLPSTRPSHRTSKNHSPLLYHA